MNAPTAYVMVEDHLPGGLEALNEGLNTTSREFNERARYYYENYSGGWADENGYDPFTWRLWGYNNKEIHDGRVSFFITNIQDRAIQLKYYARALRSGNFTALPAEVSTMYNLNLWGRSETTIVEIK